MSLGRCVRGRRRSTRRAGGRLLSGVGSKVAALLEQLPEQSLDLRADVTVRHSHAVSMDTGHRRRVVHRLQGLSGAEIHVHAARQARVEAAHRAHDVDALEVVRRVLLEDRRVLHGVLVRAGRAVHVAHARVPRRRRVRVVVRDLAALDDHVVAEHAAHCLGEPAAERLVRDRERLPGLRVRPARTSASACSQKYSAQAAA